MADELEARVRLLEAAEIVHDARLNELENWRRRDEPHIDSLVSAAKVAEEVRKALAERDGRLDWAVWQKLAAGALALVTFAGAVASFLNAIGVL